MMGMIRNSNAQFMLLAGFIISIGLVITTVILNSIIFEGNMAIGSGVEPSKNEITNLIQITKDETRSAYNNSIINFSMSKDKKIANFTSQTRNFSAGLQKIYALHGGGINMTWDISNWSSDRYAYLTEDGTAGGKVNWTVVESVKNSTIKINITSITSPFYIYVTNESKTWQINFTSEGNRIINNGDIKANITSAYNITFINGTYAAGNYSITGNTTYGGNFTRTRDYVLNTTVTLSTSRIRINVTVPVSVPG